MTYSNGDVYDGEWKEDARNGYGIMSVKVIGAQDYANEDKYNGQWRDDQKNETGNARI